VIDSRGTLLARAGQPTDAAIGMQTGEELRRTTEAKLSRGIEDMLEQTVGPGHVRAEAAVEMNFDHVNETTENYNPDQQVVRSTQTVTDKQRSTEAEKSVTVQNNLPNAEAGAPAGSGSSDDRNEETTNYEIGRTVRTMVREQPQIARISLAVMVDGTMAPGPNGKPAWHERRADELDRLKRLVQDAIGFDAKRGDTVDVVCMQFTETPDFSEAPEGLFNLHLDKADLMSLAQSAILGLVVLLALLFIVRPMALRLTAMGEAGGGGDDMLLGGPEQRALPAPGGATPSSAAAALLADESMIEMANIEGQLRASNIRKLAEMVEKHPDESLNIMRGWMSQERA
jgi:flagellar M-ring protein FliF